MLEHLKEKNIFLKECWRILKKGGILEIRVPHKNSQLAYHPSHVQFFNIYSFDQGVLVDEFVIQELGAWKVLQNDLFTLFRWQKNPFDKIVNISGLTKFVFDFFPVSGINIKLQKAVPAELAELKQEFDKKKAFIGIKESKSKLYDSIKK
jgi:SAM-dependent methyltransferase